MLTEIDFSSQQEHLRNVSRTFALTIPMLPEALIDYISNAYLLCRIADTVEDDPKAQVEKKISWLKSFSLFCKEGFNDEMELLKLHKQAVDLVHDGAVDKEFALIEDMPAVIKRTLGFPIKVRNILSKGVSILSLGMSRSLEGTEIRNINDVDHYCYYVAGVVGELLAALFSEHNHDIDKKALMDLSVSFGEGLQLTNILKDRLVDKDRDACFLPIARDGSNSAEVIKEYLAICQGHLDDALSFILRIPTKESGIRLFCLLNIAMATATLKLLNDADPETDRIVKISRKTVKILYILSKMVVKNNFLTRMFFYYISRGVKRTKRDPHELRNRVSCWERLPF
ncbi:farnesyl-diphosphate farnesyltransferase [Succinivibrio dextrinosolvens DSM 3072]|uniref:Farnesyl-diphosphate farnesyltransferase n=1 Tax=Succinivibrio dextrinosolvens DSM 3072 TaxID=1123324 RepID=A0A1T4UW14_9GAMM|nr:squalene/phytoene synthase family protein [Succinivibrio dextrinosolvens]SKA56621.1 farnesyl-diphosphate farnesyltransferase [Succinivibrio dextrinosolvens DSM 3072]